MTTIKEIEETTRTLRESGFCCSKAILKSWLNHKEDKMTTLKEIEKTTRTLHESGYCCSEAILKSITDAFSTDSVDEIPRIASGFCKGVGKTGEDICGTVAGGVMAVGVLYGRNESGRDISAACDHAAEFRRRFIDAYGTTNCAGLLEKFGDQKKMHKCKGMTAKAAGILANILSKVQIEST